MELLLDISHEAYHRDLLPGSPRLSRSMAVTLLGNSSLHAYHRHPWFGAAPIDESDTGATDNGSLLHSMILGTGAPVCIVDTKDWRTDDAKAKKAAARKEGATPVLAHVWEATVVAYQAIRAKILALGVPHDACQKEATALWEDGGTSCKARMDLLWLEIGRGARIWDLKLPDPKTSRSASPYAFQRQICGAFGMDMQAYVYREAIASIYPEIAGRIEFNFLWCESWAPTYDVAIIPVSPSQVYVGEMKWKRALNRWRACMESEAWPGYGCLAPVEAPPWALQEGMSQSLDTAVDPTWMDD